MFKAICKWLGIETRKPIGFRFPDRSKGESHATLIYEFDAPAPRIHPTVRAMELTDDSPAMIDNRALDICDMRDMRLRARGRFC